MQLSLSRTQLACLVVVILLIVACAVDTSIRSDEVLRDVGLAGRSVDRSAGDLLPAAVASLAKDTGTRPVAAAAGDRTEETTVRELGVADVGRGGLPLVQPLRWLESFLAGQASIVFTVDEARAAAALQRLEGPDLVAPPEPWLEPAADGVVAGGDADASIDVGWPSDNLRAQGVRRFERDRFQSTDRFDDGLTC